MFAAATTVMLGTVFVEFELLTIWEGGVQVQNILSVESSNFKTSLLRQKGSLYQTCVCVIFLGPRAPSVIIDNI